MVAPWPLSREEFHWLDGEDMRYCVKLDPSFRTKFQTENSNGENLVSKRASKRDLRIRMGKAD